MTEKIDAKKAFSLLNLKKYGLRLALVVLVFGVLGFFVLPPLLKALLVNQLQRCAPTGGSRKHPH